MENDMININSNYLDGQKLFIGIKAGINNLFEYKNKLDEINVFPVPDGDTGTNMCFTLLPIIEYPDDNIPDHTGEVFNIIAEIMISTLVTHINSSFMTVTSSPGNIFAIFSRGRYVMEPTSEIFPDVIYSQKYTHFEK